MDLNQNPNEQELDEEQNQSKIKQWFQDNLRIIISVLIVILIAGGIYSYSRRTEAPEPQEIADNSNISQIIGEEEPSAPQNMTEKEVTPQSSEQKNISSAATSQETESSFIETAAKGDSKTTLARTALASYLEKNPDSTLTAEHKIYIEDFLRKRVGYDGRVFVGTSIEFSKNLIQEGISKSKDLNQNQLNNLHKYAVRVPSLS